MAEARTQESRILWLLQAAWPTWTPAPELARISLQYNARIFSLRRKKGWQIESRVQIVDGVRHGSFRLARPGSFPNPRKREDQGARGVKNKTTKTCQPVAPALPETGSGLLFNLPERIHPYPD
jgi:hypothetical protein